MPFALHPQLEADTLPVGELGLCTVRLMNDSRFPWLILVPRRSGLVELFHLAANERSQLMEEVAVTARALAEATGAVKMNVGALGNVVPQLHLHVIARQEGDAAWPRPVWGIGTPRPYESGDAAALVGMLSTVLPLQ